MNDPQNSPQGYRGPWFSIEVIFKDWDTGEIRRYTQRNLSQKQLQRVREELFVVGVVIRDPDYPGTEFEIISPWAIGKIFVTMQEGFFKPEK